MSTTTLWPTGVMGPPHSFTAKLDVPVPPTGEQIVSLARYQRPDGDAIVYLLADGTLTIGYGYGIPAGLSPAATQLIHLVRFETDLGAKIIYVTGDGDIISGDGLDV